MQNAESHTDITMFSVALGKSLVPDFYNEQLDISQSVFHLALVKPRNYYNSPLLSVPGFEKIARKLSTARHGLFVREWPQSTNPSQAVETVRDEIRELTGAVLCLRAVGAYVILCGKETLWNSQPARALLDTTGFHGVIIQAIHCVDLQSGVANSATLAQLGYFVTEVASHIDMLISERSSR